MWAKLSVFLCISSYNSYKSLQVDTLITPILQMKTLRHREVKELAISHTFINGRTGILTQGSQNWVLNHYIVLLPSV